MVDISVWITTHNHELFIADAIEGVLRQNTVFTFELVIGEDCSTDRTREIVLAYKERYPDKVQLFLPEKNLGMVPMTWASYPLCTGRYIAWLDGDDYWDDPFKLQKQVDFLEANPAFSFCFHKVRLLNQRLGTFADSGGLAYKAGGDVLLIEHFIHMHNPVYALSVVHRAIPAHSLPEWLFKLPYPDWGFYLVLCSFGKAKFMRESMGVYRIHQHGAYSGQTAQHNAQQIIAFFRLLAAVVPNEYQSKIKKIVRHYRRQLLTIELKQHHFLAAARQLKLLLLQC